MQAAKTSFLHVRALIDESLKISRFLSNVFAFLSQMSGYLLIFNVIKFTFNEVIEMSNLFSSRRQTHRVSSGQNNKY